MSGVQGHVLGHLVRRGVEVAQNHFSNPQIMQKLQHDAELYENSGPEMEVKPWEFLPVMITGVLVVLLMASIRYTVGEVIASLAMIESPTTTAIIEDKPPAYADEPDAPLEKESLIPAEAEADIEVMLIKNKPITAKITTTVGHLQRVGGFRARWRGLGLSVLYHTLHNIVAAVLARLMGFGIVGQALAYILTSVGLARVHMAWTHSMIAYPSSKPFWRRFVPRKQSRAILLPSLVFALAQQATLILPLAVAVTFVNIPDNLVDFDQDKGAVHISPENCHKLLIVGLQLLAVPATAFLVAFGVLLPATVTLTRIEAALLPEGEEAIVPFDRQALMEGMDLSVRGGHRKLFVQAWRSFDRAARWRLIKVYAKMVLIQVTVAIVGLHLMLAEVYLIAGERLAIFFKSATAQLQLAAIEAEQGHM